MSYVIQNYFGIGRVIGPKKLAPFANQSDSKLRPIATWSLAFSRASSSLLAFNLRSHWLLVVNFLSADWLLKLVWLWVYWTLAEHTIGSGTIQHLSNSGFI